MVSIYLLIAIALLCSCNATPFKSNVTSAFSSIQKRHAKGRSSSGMESSHRQYTGHSCKSDSDCVSPRKCYRDSTEESCTSLDDGCRCYSLNHSNCETSSDCLPYDRCFTNYVLGICYSCSFSYPGFIYYPKDEGNCNGTVLNDGGNSGGNSGGLGDRVRISVYALSHFDESMLVFSTDRRASVLCDKANNCATSGHIVLYHGKAMTMSEYCGQVSVDCVRRVTMVSSPRMKLGLRVESNSDHLKYTALAASHETTAKKFVLKTLVRLWL